MSDVGNGGQAWAATISVLTYLAVYYFFCFASLRDSNEGQRWAAICASSHKSIVKARRRGKSGTGCF